MSNIDSKLPQKDQLFSPKLHGVDALDKPQSPHIEVSGPKHHAYYRDTLSICENAIPSNSVSEELPRSFNFKKAFHQFLGFFNFKTKSEPALKVGVNLPLSKSISESDLNSLVDSINTNVSDVKTAISIELEETQDPDLEIIDELATKIQNAIQEETRDWKKIDLLIRQLSILIVQQMAKNDQKTIQQELELLQSDIERVRKTYNTKWELTLGLTMGVIGIAGGLVSMGGGVGAMSGALSSGFLTNLKYITDGSSMLNQGLSPISQIIKNSNESKRALYNFELERNRGYKSTAESSLQNNRSSRSGMMSQVNSAIEAAYRAFISLAGG